MEELLKEILDQVKTLNENLANKNTVPKSTLNGYETCEFLGISYPSFLRLIKAGQIPHAKVQGRILCRIEALNEWLKSLEDESMKQEDEDDYFSKLRKELIKAK